MSDKPMSEKLALSAVSSVLMMTIFVLFGDHNAREPFGIDAPERIAIASLPPLKVVLARAGSRHILY